VARNARIRLGARARLGGRRCWHGGLGRAFQWRCFVPEVAPGGRGFPGWRRLAGWRVEDWFSALTQARPHRRPAPAAAGGLVGLGWRAPRRTRLPEHQTSGRRSSSPMLPAIVIISAEACRTVKGQDGRAADLELQALEFRRISRRCRNLAPNKETGKVFASPVQLRSSPAPRRSTSEPSDTRFESSRWAEPISNPRLSRRRTRVEKCELLSSGRRDRRAGPNIENMARGHAPCSRYKATAQSA
jgi:hypothetical protein